MSDESTRNIHRDTSTPSDLGPTGRNSATRPGTHPLHPAPMSSDPSVDNITGAGDKPQYDAGEEP